MRAKQPDEIKERNKELGALMREARTSKGETVTRCAEEYLGITRQRYDLMERGEANIGWGEFAHLMEKLEVADEWLLPRMRDRGLLLGAAFDTQDDRPSAVAGLSVQGGTAQPGESLEQVERGEGGERGESGGGQLPKGAAHGTADEHATSNSASTRASTPPIPVCTPEHLLLPLTDGYGYTVQVLDADGAIIYTMDWAHPRRRRVRTARLRPVPSTAPSKTSATAAM
ncbi:MAG TPA: hypothetical protein VF952_09060 [Chloroflexia bacterium]